ncbi:MAG: M23 family metallopeptidase [Microcoleus vaginatus WJT46-NPBG5]|jgi:murein DD-endopeptidase MepM/ murein hydrolase activator NlpD|nr:M23 family metallopeptidase [Microcoleus vaginatus WJT46-NPBG5]
MLKLQKISQVIFKPKSQSKNLKLRSFFITLLCLGIGSLETQVNAQPTKSGNCQAPALSRVKQHTIAAGETLESIAAQYNLIPSTLMGMNPILQKGEVPVGSEILIPPYNGIRVEVPAGKTWESIATTYNVRPDVLFEVNGCQPAPQVVFVPGVNWSPKDPAEQNTPNTTDRDANGVAGYPLAEEAPVILRYGWQLMPLRGEVGFHSGIDLQAKAGTPILAAGIGIVAFAGEQGNYGNLVVVNHPRGKQTRYAHLDTISVKAGQQINQGDPLGTVGSTGSPDVKEAHLHFEIRYSTQLGWVAEDPQKYIGSMSVTQSVSVSNDSTFLTK